MKQPHNKMDRKDDVRSKRDKRVEKILVPIKGIIADDEVLKVAFDDFVNRGSSRLNVDFFLGIVQNHTNVGV